jgi:hypothetical protein
VPHEERRGCRQRVRLPLDHHGEVEQITRRRTVPTVVHLLGDHLPGRLDAHRPPLDLPPLPRRIGEVRCGHEVDLAFLELQLDERARHLRVLLGQGCRGVAESGRHVAEVLRVRHEDVDVLAEAVSVPEHQDCSASEGPERVRMSPMALDVVDQPQRSLEQHFPGAGRQRPHCTLITPKGPAGARPVTWRASRRCATQPWGPRPRSRRLPPRPSPPGAPAPRRAGASGGPRSPSVRCR